MTKSDIRKDKLYFRSHLTSCVIEDKSKLICDKVLNSNEYLISDIILCYSDFKGEVKTKYIIENALKMSKLVYLPRVDFESLKMDFYRINLGDSLDKGYMGIDEPSILSEMFDYKALKNKKIMMIVPGVAFSDKLNRIGFGKGFYDKYLSDKPLIYKCGIAYSEQIFCNYDSDCFDEYDIRMDTVVTDNQIYI